MRTGKIGRILIKGIDYTKPFHSELRLNRLGFSRRQKGGSANAGQKHIFDHREYIAAEWPQDDNADARTVSLVETDNETPCSRDSRAGNRGGALGVWIQVISLSSL
jgi:hypothetical protein